MSDILDMCKQCGGACCHVGSPPLNDKSSDGICIWFNPASGICMYYELRPDVCKRFIPGSRNCVFYQQLRDKTYGNSN